MEITGKVAIVTGAGGKGSGRAIASRLARDGAVVVVSDINDAGGRDTVARIERAGGKAAYFGADVRVEAQVRSLIAFAEKTFRRIIRPGQQCLSAASSGRRARELGRQCAN
jgi:NAD(P)-dependent dehydrogenase (short-subunit alcohol dehydrogenase family)